MPKINGFGNQSKQLPNAIFADHLPIAVTRWLNKNNKFFSQKPKGIGQ